LTATIFSDVIVSVLDTLNVDLEVKDQASTTYGNYDGVTLCGARTYSVDYTINGVSVTPDFISLSSSSITIAPTSGS